MISKGIVLTALMASGAAYGQAMPSYDPAQAERGRSLYAVTCAACHGPDLGGGQFGPPLKGVNFRQRWAAQPVADLFEQVRTMPPGQARSMSDTGYAELVALMLAENGIAAGQQALPTDVASLRAMVLPGKAAPGPRQSAGGGLTRGYKLPFWPQPPNPLDSISPVTDALLTNPPEGDWLQWRRTWDAKAFSPLDQVNRNNVKDLGVAWSLALPPGPNAATPLVHDGVIFVHAFRDNVLALDAATGAQLWQYSRQLPEGVAPSVKRNLALYGDKLYVGTSDAHLVALDVKTGVVVWDKEIGAYASGLRLTGGPLAAKGKVIIGTLGRSAGGPYVAAYDAVTGAEAWRFYTIARPGEPGGNTWNDLPLEKRNGGSVWTAGYYDPVTNLAYFGVAPTYDTGPLRNPVGKRGITNDALYTDATVAINPDTGKLVWHYQHMQNDQWDLDWGFERQVLNLKVGGKDRRVVVTGGKLGIFDVMDAKTGEYLSSTDIGWQNLVTKIDPKTGYKTTKPELLPGDGKTKFMCPHAGGGRSWMPTAINPESKVMFVPAVESCMALAPVAQGERGSLTTGVRWELMPHEKSDGKYGRVQAINLETRQTVWTARDRAPTTTGVLATAGGVVFAGALDRFFKAYDESNGNVLWKARLSDVPSSAPITYTVDGKQYVAIVVGYGSAQAASFGALVPEIVVPVIPSSSVYVFALP